MFLIALFKGFPNTPNYQGKNCAKCIHAHPAGGKTVYEAHLISGGHGKHANAEFVSRSMSLLPCLCPPSVVQ